MSNRIYVATKFAPSNMYPGEVICWDFSGWPISRKLLDFPFLGGINPHYEIVGCAFFNNAIWVAFGNAVVRLNADTLDIQAAYKYFDCWDIKAIHPTDGGTLVVSGGNKKVFYLNPWGEFYLLKDLGSLPGEILDVVPPNVLIKANGCLSKVNLDTNLAGMAYFNISSLAEISYRGRRREQTITSCVELKTGFIVGYGDGTLVLESAGNTKTIQLSDNPIVGIAPHPEFTF